MTTGCYQCAPSLFFEFAKKDPEVWNKLINRRIDHKTFGTGRIVDYRDGIIFADFSQILSESTKDRNLRKLSTLIFSNAILNEFEVPDDLIPELDEFRIIYEKRIEEERKEALAREEANRKWEAEREERNERRRQQEEQEKDARNEFIRLKKKYLVKDYPDNSPISQLFEILVRIEGDEMISKDQLTWLRDKNIYPVLAVCYEKFANSGDPMKLASAGSFWRKAGCPERALKITDQFIPNENSDKATILTMRGGAFRDIKDFENAEACGLEAMSLMPNKYFPYNLLGALYVQMGIPEKGEEFFEKAKKLGSKNDENRDFQKALKLAEPEARRKSAEYFLKKDPEKYKWAANYLK